jgi:hypothetical protein
MWQDIVFSVTIVTIGRPFHPFHDHLGMEALQVFLFGFLVASRAVYLLIRSVLSPLGMFIIFNMGMAI